MGWTKEDLAKIYQAVKETAREINPSGKTAEMLKYEIKEQVKFRLGIRKYVRGHNGRMHRLPLYPNTEARKFKPFVKGKYGSMGLPSKEQTMLGKMIDSVVDEMDINKTSLHSLNDAVSKAESVAVKARSIANDCEDIMVELDKISDYLDGN